MSALDKIRTKVTVDIDQLDPQLAARLGPFCDMTSNQALIANYVTTNPDCPIVKRCLARARLEAKTPEEAADMAIDLLAVGLAKAVLPNITGRVHAQVSPRFAYNKEAIVQHGQRLISAFAAEGIRQDRVCLKIPSTGAGIAACAELEAQGVRTLATILFSVDQAIAAAQAKCLYIAPYWNELSVHFEPETWIEYAIPEVEHPSAETIRRIKDVYAGVESPPLVMPASIVTSKEALAIAALGPDHITISGPVLAALATDQYGQDFSGAPLKLNVPSEGHPTPGSQTVAHSNVDFLANDGALLDESIKADPSVARRLAYALQAFTDCEQRVANALLQSSA